MEELSSFKKLKEVAGVFLHLGITGFGGPAAHLALMEKELVRKRKWLTAEQYLDLVGVSNLIPGPTSTEVAMHCGQQRAGWMGLWVAGVCFILPVALLTGIIAYFYALYGQLPRVLPVFKGVQPVIAVVVADALWIFARKSVKNYKLLLIALLVLAGTFAGLNAMALLLFAGILSVALTGSGKNGLNQSFAVGPWPLFWVFFKTGATLFGSGYVLFAYLDDELVKRLGWLPRQQLIDAIAVGQFTPGPVLASCTFIGYQLNGAWGALAATLGVFLPAFLFVQLMNPLVKIIRNSRPSALFLDGVNCACVALLAVVCFQIAKTAVADWKTLLLAAAAGLVVFQFRKVNTAFVILAGAIIGWLWL